jgi:two-component system LytT family response regulator
MKPIQTLLIDDEISALNTLRGMLGEYCPEVEVAGTAGSVEEALRLTARLRPDLVFLDIEMPPFGNGFDFLNRSRHFGYGVIFTTAYPQYAVKAINEVQPWGYLIKPFSVPALREAIGLAVTRMAERGQGTLPEMADNQALVIADSRKGHLVLRYRDILCFEADGATSDIVLWRKDKIERLSVYRTLRELEAELPETLFCRTHHGYIVNMAHVQRYERTGRNGVIYLKDNSLSVGISVQKMEHFVQRFEGFLQK